VGDRGGTEEEEEEEEIWGGFSNLEGAMYGAMSRPSRGKSTFTFSFLLDVLSN